MKHWLAIISMCVLASVAYGIVHDQITIRVCHEYFTQFHPRIFPTDNHTLIALGWGVIATWWVGLPLGALLAMTARAGRRPRLGAKELVVPLARTLIVVGCVATIVGVIAWVLLRDITLPDPAFELLDPDRHGRLATCWVIHNTSYWGGGVAGVWLAVSIFRRRKLTRSSDVHSIP